MIRAIVITRPGLAERCAMSGARLLGRSGHVGWRRFAGRNGIGGGGDLGFGGVGFFNGGHRWGCSELKEIDRESDAETSQSERQEKRGAAEGSAGEFRTGGDFLEGFFVAVCPRNEDERAHENESDAEPKGRLALISGLVLLESGEFPKKQAKPCQNETEPH